LTRDYVKEGIDHQVRLEKRNESCELKIVVVDGWDKNDEYKKDLKLITALISDILEGYPVNIYLCNNKFDTLHLIRWLNIGRIYLIEEEGGGGAIYYGGGVTIEEVKKLAKLLVKDGYAAAPKSPDFQLWKIGDEYRILFSLSKDHLKELERFMREEANRYSIKVFNGKRTRFGAWDDDYEIIEVL